MSKNIRFSFIILGVISAIMFTSIKLNSSSAVSFSTTAEQKIYIRGWGSEGETNYYKINLNDKYRGTYRIIKAEVENDNEVIIWVEPRCL